jgi:hypothetical protein
MVFAEDLQLSFDAAYGPGVSCIGDIGIIRCNQAYQSSRAGTSYILRFLRIALLKLLPPYVQQLLSAFLSLHEGIHLEESVSEASGVLKFPEKFVFLELLGEVTGCKDGDLWAYAKVINTSMSIEYCEKGTCIIFSELVLSNKSVLHILPPS